jgi:hypothetical protein
MTYELAFLDEALKEWRKLDALMRASDLTGCDPSCHKTYSD